MIGYHAHYMALCVYSQTSEKVCFYILFILDFMKKSSNFRLYMLKHTTVLLY